LATCEEVAVDCVYGFQEEPIKFVSFEDTIGLYETIFFPKAYNQFCHMLNEMRPYILKGKIEEDFGSITMTVSWIGFLDRYKQGRNGRAMQKA
jgi:DNA polymerase III alpha subunit